MPPDHGTDDWLHLESRTPPRGDTPGTQRTQQTQPQIQDPVKARKAANPSIPGYEILDVLGKGGMGLVYLARHEKLNRLVAIKMILAGAHADADDLQRFRTEAEAVARLQHPNIVQVFEFGESNGIPFCVFEYLPGGSLAQRLRGQPQPPRDAAALTRQLALGMHAAHQAGILHRDLKPANVLLMTNAECRMPNENHTTTPQIGILHPAFVIPKITDFGLAKRLDAEAGQTQTGEVIGTPSYMAPEQAAGKISSLGPTADIYSLGAVLYEMLTGRPPFNGLNAMDTLLQVMAAEPVSPSRLQPGVPRDLETICLKCLRKDSRQRYPDAHDLAQDLQAYLEGKSIAARPIGGFERAWRWCRRNPTVAGLSALVLLLLVAGTAISAYFAFTATQRAEDYRLEKERAKRLQQEAEQNARLARQYDRASRDALRTYFFEVSQDSGLQQDALLPLRKKLLGNAKDYFLAFLRERGNDPSLQLEATETRFHLAMLYAEIGERPAAIATFAETIHSLKSAINDKPEQETLKHRLGQCLTNVSSLYEETGKPQEAIAALQQSMPLFEELYRLHPAVLLHGNDLVVAHLKLGRLYFNLGRASEADVEYRAALQVLEVLLKQHPRHAALLDLLAAIKIGQGNAAARRAQWKEAEAAYQTALDAHRDAGVPRPLSSPRDLAGCWHNLGQIHFNQRRLKEAEEAFRQALLVLEPLAERNPSLLDVRGDLARTWNSMGNVAWAGRRPDVARQAYQKALALLESLLQAQPQVIGYAITMGGLRCNLGHLRKESHEPEQAMIEYDKARVILQDILRRMPGNPEAKHFLVNTLRSRADTLDEFKRHQEAGADWKQVIALSTGRTKAEAQVHGARSLAKSGDVAEALQTADEALKQPRLPAEWLFVLTEAAAALVSHDDATTATTAPATALALRLFKQLQQQEVLTEASLQRLETEERFQPLWKQAVLRDWLADVKKAGK